jgi:fibronectin-binding autotransporter adhesin
MSRRARVAVNSAAVFHLNPLVLQVRRALGLSAVCVALTAAPPLLAAERAPEHASDPLARQKLTGSGKEVVFIDAAVADYQRLEAALPHGMEVILLDPRRDALDQITETLSSRPFTESVHLISHGAPGQLVIGGRVYTAERLEHERNKLALWFNPLVSTGAKRPDILIYGCDVAAGADGKKFLGELASLTGADVEGSSDLTGSPLKGGNWELEVATGLIETRTAIATGAVDWPHTLAANVFTVTKTADTNDGTCDTDCSLREAIVASNGTPNAVDAATGAKLANKIVFDATVFNTPQTITLTAGHLYITRSATITGGQRVQTPGYGSLYFTYYNPVTIDAAGGSRVLNLYNYGSKTQSVTLRNFYLVGGNSANYYGDGGAIYDENVSLTLGHSVVTGNYAQDGGGIALGANVKSLSVVGSYKNGYYANYSFISNNVAHYTAGGGRGGGIFFETGPRHTAVNLTYAYTVNNYSERGGGGVYVPYLAGTSTLSFNRGVVAGNAAYYNGGGAYFGGLYNSAAVTITRTKFNNNYSYANGGGVSFGSFHDSSKLTTTRARFNGNQAHGGLGGGIHMYDVRQHAIVTIDGGKDGQIKNNNSSDHLYGGGLWARRVLEDGTLKVSNSTISGNYSQNTGGGIALYRVSDRGVATIAGNQMSYNYSSTGGGLYVHRVNDSATLSLGGTTASHNGAFIGGVAAVKYVDNYSTADVSGGTFNSNSGFFGGAIAVNQVNDFGALNLLGLKMGKAPSAPYYYGNSGAVGGAIDVRTMSNYSVTTVAGSTLTDNSATYVGGGLSFGTVQNYASLNVSTSTLSGNSSYFFNGGGLYLGTAKNNATVSVQLSTISGNKAINGGGGGISLGTNNGIYGSAAVKVENCTLSGNTANGRGGGAYVTSNFLKTTLAHVTVTGNYAGTFGGGIALNGYTALSHALVIGNTAGSGGYDLYNVSGTFYSDFSLFGDVTNGPSVYPALYQNPTTKAFAGGNIYSPTTIAPATVVSPTLADNGGPTLTHDLVAGSPAIDAGNPDFAPPPATDQRGFVRVAGKHIDIGAVESGSQPAAPNTNGPGAGLGLSNGGAGSMPLASVLLMGLAGLWRRVRRGYRSS